MRLVDIFSGRKSQDDIAGLAHRFERRFGGEARGGRDERRADYRGFENAFYNLVTDFYEFGWGRSFHFAPRAEGESFAASIARHEHYLAHRLDLQPGMVAADLGCGVGGPLIEIARFSGARIVGITDNAMHLERAAARTEAAGLSHLADFLQCDFMQVDAPDHSFDAIFSIEATCCAPDKAGVYGEAFRLLRPGGRLGVYEYCLTDRFDEQDPEHLRLKADMEYGGALPGIARPHDIDEAVRRAGFELLEARDLSAGATPGIPWYQPLAGSGLSPAGFRSSPAGRRLTQGTLWLLERLHVVPRGTTTVAAFLRISGDAFAEAGRLGIFSPMYFVLARKQ